MHGIGSTYGVLAFPTTLIAVALTFSGASAWLGFMALILLPVGYFCIPFLCRPVLRRVLASRSLAPTSRRLVAESARSHPPERQRERAYKVRARNLRNGRRGPKRLRALGRGFYYGR
ncbi:MAG: hypothetical protein GY811_00680 [Myxococcales bacterium]|nr:hypothetical protein [Myxococcales bacterium]